MQNWEKEINKVQYLKSFDIEKSFNSELITEDEFNSFMGKGGYIVVDENDIEKSTKDTSKLIKKEVWVSRGGKQFKQTVWVSPDDNKEVETPIGSELSPSVKGLEIERYSDKSILIKGDTYANIDLMRQIKSETGFGTWSGKAKGWIFGLTQLDKVLGLIWSNVKDKDQDKAQAIQNQKNSSLIEGDGVNVLGEKGKVEEIVSDSQGIKYNVTLEDGTKFQGVDEKVIEVVPEKDDKKISEILANSQPENRAKTEKQLFGIKPIENIHTYSLEDYMKLHGLSEEDIQRAINRIKPKEKKESENKRTTSGGGGTKSEKGQTENLTKNQLIGKLIIAHYQAVQKAIEAGEEVPESALTYYPELAEKYSKQRQAMREETKRKISEALKKNKPEEVVPEKTKEQTAKEAAEAFFAGLSQEELDKLKDSFKSAVNGFVEKEQEKLAELVKEKAENDKEYYRLQEEARGTETYGEKQRLQEEARKLSPRRNKLTKLIRTQENRIQAISNGGDLMSFPDQTGLKHENIPDFTKIDTSNIYYDVDTILTEPKPKFIPNINEELFKMKGFILDAIRIDKDTYMVATEGHEELGESMGFSSKTQKNEYSGYDSETSGYVVLTLDQLVLTNDYYVTKQKGAYKDAANKRNQRQIDHWNSFDDKKKEYYYSQKNFYESVPVVVKKKVTKEQWNNLSLQEKEKLYIPVKKYNPEKLKTTIEDGKMWTSFHEMYERFVDINAQRYTIGGSKIKLGERKFGSYGHPEVFQSWNTFSEMLNWKLNDIKIQRESDSEIRRQAIETSFGMSNTNNSLLEKDGVLVKRQNGEQIKPQEIEQLEKAWGDVQKSFGSLKENAQKDNLKLSHSGNTYIYASKAAGIYIPAMKTIAVSNKFGEDQFGFTLGHETAHWIDNTLGEKKGKRFASDDYESTAGQIAIAFRKSLNKKADNAYTDSTTECFARALEQYHAIETKGEMAEMAKMGRYFASADYAPKEVYESKIKPLIKQFFEENKDILKSTLFDFFA